MLNPARDRARRWRQHGLSLVELLVGVAIGLFVVAGAATVVSSQLADSRRLAVEAQIQQDLRAAADIVSRQLRRGGSNWPSPNGVWAPGMTPTVNPYAAITVTPNPTTVAISWSGATVLGFRVSAGALQLQDSGGNWQALTDASAVTITNFIVTLNTAASSVLACPAYCPTPAFPANSTTCWPTVEIREFLVEIDGRAVSDPNVKRSFLAHVRVPNDRIVNNYPGGPALCPT